MRYLILNSIVAVIFITLLAVRYGKHTSLRRIVYTLSVLILLTAIFDSLIIKYGIVAYNRAHILGVYIIKAPIEDFFYTIVAAAIGPLLWDYYERKK